MMMYSIDLLKGQGKPKPKKRGTLLLVALASVIPVLILFYLTSQYVFAQTEIPTKQARLNKLEKAVSASDGYLDSKLQKCTLYLKDVDSVLKASVQWSDMLIKIVSNMPESVIMDSLGNKVNTYTDEVVSKADSSKKIKVTKTRNIINMTFFADNIETADSDMQVYIKKLTSLGLGAVIKNQGAAFVKDKQVRMYQIECIIEKD